MNGCHILYYSALRAARAYDRAIKNAYGKMATRWTIPRSLVESAKNAYGQLAVARACGCACACDVMRRG